MHLFNRVNTLFFLLLFITGVHFSFAQRVFNHPLSYGADGQQRLRMMKASSVPETLNVLVAMVAFKEDAESRTTGKGSFDTTHSTKKTIDPSPHDRKYVQNHMLFVENYFRKVSSGAFIVKATVIDTIYTLAKQMASYSPPRTSTNNIELGYLMQDVWHLVDSVSPLVQFQDYNAFMIFHAGVGRDVDLSSVLGFDPGPFDIPSVYINLANLQKMFGSAYTGVPVRGNSFFVKNSLVIPETENRVINSGLGNSLLQLGINGLICASIGSHIGLPDLFDTKKGRSGIGRFGLMDGQSIFSWNGVFPPEPSAWEKYFMGWVTPIVVPPGETLHALPAVSLNSRPDSIYRVPISAKEYFLVENRNRDANRDGAIITIARNDSVVQRTFFRDTTHFSAFDQDSIYGVVTDVDEFDWSLPGGTNTRTGEWFNGGILIWHIDENVIDANLATDAVNADPNRRGVNLMEADGSQDIGQAYGFISAGAGSEDGTPFDFWYHGNQSTPRIISNEFTPSSNPGSLSNDHANSHIYIKNFSVRGPRMTATILLGDDVVKPLAGFPKKIGSALGSSSVLPADLDGDGILELVVSTSGKKSWLDTSFITDGKILALRQNGSSFFPTSDSLPIFESDPTLSFDPPITVDFDGDGKADIVTYRHRTNNKESAPGQKFVFAARDTDSNGNGDELFASNINDFPPNIIPFASICASDSFICWAGGGFDVLRILSPHIGTYTGSFITGVALFEGPKTFTAIFRDSTLIGPSNVKLPVPLSGSPAVADFNGDGSREVVVLGKDGEVFMLDAQGKSVLPFPVNFRQPVSSSPAIGDINGDGKKDIMFTAGKKLYAINSAGVPLDFFPINIPTQSQLYSSPVVGDIDGDGKPDILVGTQEGEVFAYSSSGKLIAGFPLQTGGKIFASPTLFKTQAGNVGIAVGTDDHYLYAWELSANYDSTKMPWPMYLHDPQHSGFEGSVTVSNPLTTFFPASRAYNWPNPVRSVDNFKTHIRYYVASDAKVNVKIFDMAGSLVGELSGNGIGGLDNEMEWDVSSIQSGVYFAHIDAQGANGSGSSVIKIAVVK